MGENDYVLCLLIRKDMDSLQHAGKMIAQGAHAANHAAAEIGKGIFGTPPMMIFSQWEKSTAQGFGTTLIFSGIIDRRGHRGLTLDDITKIVDFAKGHGVAAGVTHDPSYPLHDGNTVHAIPCDTCGWLFGAKDQLSIFTRPLTLQPAEAGAF